MLVSCPTHAGLVVRRAGDKVTAFLFFSRLSSTPPALSPLSITSFSIFHIEAPPPRPVRRCLSLLPRPPGEPSVPASSTPQFNGQQRRPDAASRLRARVDPWRFERQCSVCTSEADSVCLRRVSVNPLVNPSSPAPRSCECN